MPLSQFSRTELVIGAEAVEKLSKTVIAVQDISSIPMELLVGRLGKTSETVLWKI